MMSFTVSLNVFLKVDSKKKLGGSVGKLAIVGHHYGTVAIEGYLHFERLVLCKKSISVSACTSLIKGSG